MEDDKINLILIQIKKKFKVKDKDIKIIKKNEDVIFKVNYKGDELEFEFKKKEKSNIIYQVLLIK